MEPFRCPSVFRFTDLSRKSSRSLSGAPHDTPPQPSRTLSDAPHDTPPQPSRSLSDAPHDALHTAMSSHEPEDPQALAQARRDTFCRVGRGDVMSAFFKGECTYSSLLLVPTLLFSLSISLSLSLSFSLVLEWDYCE